MDVLEIDDYRRYFTWKTRNSKKKKKRAHVFLKNNITRSLFLLLDGREIISSNDQQMVLSTQFVCCFFGFSWYEIFHVHSKTSHFVRCL